MTPTHLPVDAPLSLYQLQADQVLAGHAVGNAFVIEMLRNSLPTFLDPEIPWKPLLPLSDAEILDYPLTPDDARLAVARGYSFRDWDALQHTIREMQIETSPVRAFELAAEAVINGDLKTLSDLLRVDPQLVHARSSRITCHEPAVHGATLLHYLAANGTENYRQRSPENAVEIARLLLDAGAQVDALAGLYGGECATLSLLVSSTPPAEAGVQVPLVHLLVDYGANLEGAGDSEWQSPLHTALVFGFLEAARALVQRGAPVHSIANAAGLGMLNECRALLPTSTPEERHRALALAVENDQLAAVRLLLAAGERPDRFNPEGLHGHQTPLHSAALRGNLALVQLLLEFDASLEIRDSLWKSTPLGWAEHGEQQHIVEFLRRR